MVEKLVHSKEEWRRILPHERYRVLFEAAPAAYNNEVRRILGAGHLRLLRLRSPPLQLEDEVPLRLRMAELLSAYRAGCRRRARGPVFQG